MVGASSGFVKATAGRGRRFAPYTLDLAYRRGPATEPRAAADCHGGTLLLRRTRATHPDIGRKVPGMNQPLKGKVALVAGATRGAGRGIAVQLGAAGATVYVTGRSTREAQSEMQ